MASDAYKLDDYTTLDVTEADSDTAIPVAGVQNVTIIPSFSLEQLYTADSVTIEEQLQHEAEIQVEIGYSLWDVDFVKQWLGGQGGTSSTSLTDTSDPQKFNMDFEIDSVRGERTLGPLTVEGITFEELPIVDMSRGEFEQWDLSGTGENITGVDVTDNTSA